MDDLHGELQNVLSLIRVEASSIDFLNNLKDFYNLILDKIYSSRNHIYLSTLYIGTDPLSKNIVRVIFF